MRASSSRRVRAARARGARPCRADRPVPVAERSRRPGATTTAFLETAPTPCHGSAIWTMLTPAISGVLGMDARQLLARRDADLLAGARESSARLRRLEREPERRRVGDRVPHAAEGDVDRQRAEPVDLERGVEPVGEARDVRQLDALALAVRAAAPSPRRRRQAPRAAGSSRARASRPSPSRAARSRRRSCSSRTSPGTRSAP